MKPTHSTHPLVAILVLAFAWAALAHGAAGGEPYALLVGINRYPNFESRDLHGAVNDVASMERVLAREYGFPPERVRTLRDDAATLDGVRREFAAAASKLTPDDVFVFQFCGHGMQLPDQPGGDETDDQLDEALCTFGCTSLGSNVLVDDELDQMLSALPCRSVVVILDCCYSGTGTKSVNRVAAVRSLPTPPRSTAAPAPASAAKAAPRRTDQQQIVFTACSDKQQSREIFPLGAATTASAQLVGFQPQEFQMGLFSYYLLEGLRGAADADGDGAISNREADSYVRSRLDAAFNGAQASVDERQTPTLEYLPRAPLDDAPFLGVKQKGRFHARVSPLGSGRARIDAGAMHGVGVHQLLGLFRDQQLDADPRGVLGQIEIDKLGLDFAEARLVRGIRVETNQIAAPVANAVAERAILFKLEVTGGPSDPEKVATAALRAELEKLLAADKRLRLSDGADFELSLSVNVRKTSGTDLAASAVWLQSNGEQPSPQDLPLPSGASVSAVAGKLAERAAQLAAELAMRQTLAGLTNPSAGFGLQVVVDRPPKAADELAEYRVGEELVLGMKSTADCWYYILAIRPDGRTQLWSPTAGDRRRALAGQPYLFPAPGSRFILDGPPGVYVAKVIASRDMLPAGTVSDQGVRTEVFRQLPWSDWATASISFRVSAP